jgi:hypothetical protein
MTEQEKSAILAGAQNAFFEAMLDGYAGGENRKSVKTELNNGHTKRVVFQDEENHPGYIVEDEWDIHPNSDQSAGTTRILLQGGPVWRMSYGGHYPKGAIPFLKSAMAKAYERKLFLGGRGMDKVISEHYEVNELRFYLVYINKWNGDFQSFNGIEEIFQNPLIGYDPELIGCHQYFGMALI